MVWVLDHTKEKLVTSFIVCHMWVNKPKISWTKVKKENTLLDEQKRHKTFQTCAELSSYPFRFCFGKIHIDLVNFPLMLERRQSNRFNGFIIDLEYHNIQCKTLPPISLWFQLIVSNARSQLPSWQCRRRRHKFFWIVVLSFLKQKWPTVEC